MPSLGQLDKIKSAGGGIRGGVDGQKGRQHGDASDHGVNEELEGGAGPAGAAPQFDQEKSRDQAQFPKKKPMNEVLRREDAEKARFQEEHQRKIELGVALDLPGGQQRKRHDQSGKQHHQQPQAIHAQMIVYLQRGHPRNVLDELHRAGFGVEGRPEFQRQRQRQQAGREGQIAPQLLPRGAKQSDHHANRQRQKCQDG